MKTKATNFHALAVMQELVGMFLFRGYIHRHLWTNFRNRKMFSVFCRKEETDTMVGCDNHSGI